MYVYVYIYCISSMRTSWQFHWIIGKSIRSIDLSRHSKWIVDWRVSMWVSGDSMSQKRHSRRLHIKSPADNGRLCLFPIIIYIYIYTRNRFPSLVYPLLGTSLSYSLFCLYEKITCCFLRVVLVRPFFCPCLPLSVIFRTFLLVCCCNYRQTAPESVHFVGSCRNFDWSAR